MKRFLKKYIPDRMWRLMKRCFCAVSDAVSSCGPYVRKRRYCGYELYYNRGNALVKRLKTEHIYEEGLCEKLVHELGLRSGEGFLDIGANIGLVSIFVASRISHIPIFAFEPGPVQRSFLAKTVTNNNLGDAIHVYSEAVGERESQMTFYSHGDKESGYDGFIETGRTAHEAEITVDVVTIDAWWDSCGRPKIGVLKIDIEGAELFALRGARGFLDECRPVIFLEIESRNLKVYPYTESDVLSYLNTIGYDLCTLEGAAVDGTNVGRIREMGDTFCARPRMLS